MALLVCVLCQSIEPSLHQLDFFSEIFYGDLFLFFLIFICCSSIVVPMHPQYNYCIIAWADTVL